MNIESLQQRLQEWQSTMTKAKEPVPDDFTWYGYDILGNVTALNALCSGATKKELSALGACRVADIGCADGDLGFLLASQGHPVELIDWPATNWNSLRGARLLKDRLGLEVELHEVDLDSQFQLPSERYGFVFLLGILYHLKNPFYVLEAVARVTKYCAISTRVFRYASAIGSDREQDLSGIPVAYLVNPMECNNDPTNFWMLTLAGLQRLVDRAGWEIMDQHTWGPENSNPADTTRDERAFMLLKSRHFGN